MTIRMLCLLLLSLVAVGCAGVPITAPRNLAVQRLADGVRLTWEDASPFETELLIERRAPGESFKRLASVPADTVDFLDASPVPGAGDCSYRVLAFVDGEPATGSYSREVGLAN